MAWFGFGVAVTAVLAYYTSSSKVLWIFPSPYPDVWGPFLSRNNFAQFLELIVPVALWLGLQSTYGRMWLAMAAAMLAAGLCSASRAGGILLLVEVVAVLALTRTKRTLWFAAAACACVALMGAGHFLDRLQSADALAGRREIYSATVAMIRSSPWTGYGLGTFSLVFPEFAEADTGLIVDHAHNDWLEWSAEGGMVFVTLWAMWALPLCRAGVRSIWGVGVAALFLHSLVDYPFARPGVAAWLSMLAGMLYAAGPEDFRAGSFRAGSFRAEGFQVGKEQMK
jgi:O-antigen ligase